VYQSRTQKKKYNMWRVSCLNMDRGAKTPSDSVVRSLPSRYRYLHAQSADSNHKCLLLTPRTDTGMMCGRATYCNLDRGAKIPCGSAVRLLSLSNRYLHIRAAVSKHKCLLLPLPACLRVLAGACLSIPIHPYPLTHATLTTTHMRIPYSKLAYMYISTTKLAYMYISTTECVCTCMQTHTQTHMHTHTKNAKTQ